MGEKLAKMISECDLFFKRSLKQGEDNLKGYESNLAKAISLKTTFPLFLDDGKDIPDNKGKVWPRDYYPDKPSFVTFGDFFSWAFDKNTGTRRYTYADMGEPEKFFVDPVTRKNYYTKDTFIYRMPKFVNMSGYFNFELDLDETNISEMNNIAYLFDYLSGSGFSYDSVRKHKIYLKAVEIGADKFSNIVLNTILSNISKDFIKTKWDKFYPDKYWNSGFGDVDNNGNIIGKDYGIIDIIGREYPILPEIYGDDSWFWIENPWYRRGEIVFEALIEKINETDNVQSVAVEGPAPVQENVQKIRLHLVGFDDNFQIKAKQDLPDFKIYLGDIPIAEDPNKFNDYDNFENSEDGVDDSAFQEEKLVFDGEVITAFSDSELSRDNKISEGDGVGVKKGDDKVLTPGAVVPSDRVVLGAFAGVRNSNLMTKQSTGTSKIEIADFITPKGEKITKSEIIKNINEFLADVLSPFAAFLKSGYPDLYNNFIVTSTTRAYVPSGGSSTSQHFRGQAIDCTILGATAKNPDGNIKLLNAILTWYGKNPVGYGQILFETRGNSCWVHWSYKRGNNRLMLARFKEDSILKVSANTNGKYVLPPLTTSSLGFA